MEAYHAALASLPVRAAGRGHVGAGTVGAAIASYYTHNSFRALADGTRGMRRAILERFRAEHGDKRLATMQRQHVAAMLGGKKPFAARKAFRNSRA